MSGFYKFLITLNLVSIYSIINSSSSSVIESSTYADRDEDKKKKHQGFENTMQMIRTMDGKHFAQATLLSSCPLMERKEAILIFASDKNNKVTIEMVEKGGPCFFKIPHGNKSETIYAAMVNMDTIQSKIDEPLPLLCLHAITPMTMERYTETLRTMRKRYHDLEKEIVRNGESTAPMLSNEYFRQVEIDIVETRFTIESLKQLIFQLPSYPMINCIAIDRLQHSAVQSTYLELFNFLVECPLIPTTNVDRMLAEIVSVSESTETLIYTANSQRLRFIGEMANIKIFPLQSGKAEFMDSFEFLSSSCIVRFLCGSMKLSKAGKTIANIETIKDIREQLVKHSSMLLTMGLIRKDVNEATEILLIEYGLMALVTQPTMLPSKYVNVIRKCVSKIRQQEGVARKLTARKLESTLMLATEIVNRNSTDPQIPFALSSFVLRILDLVQYRRDRRSGFSNDFEKTQQQTAFYSPNIKRYNRFITNLGDNNKLTLVIWMDATFRLCQKGFTEKVDSGSDYIQYRRIEESKLILKRVDAIYNGLVMIFPLITPEYLCRADDTTLSDVINQFDEMIDGISNFVSLNKDKLLYARVDFMQRYYSTLFTDQCKWLKSLIHSNDSY